MPRRPRLAAGDLAYHVLNRRVGRLPLFEKPGDYRAFEQVLAEAVAHRRLRIAAYCLMPNHWHLLLWPRHDGELSEAMRWITGTHTQRWHAHRHTAGTGPVYQGRFKSFPVQTEEHFLTVARYVERNALRAKLVDRAEDWRWGSLWRRGQADPAQVAWLSAWPVERPRDSVCLSYGSSSQVIFTFRNVKSDQRSIATGLSEFVSMCTRMLLLIMGSITAVVLTNWTWNVDGTRAGEAYYAYDDLDRLTTVVDEAGNTAIYNYDAVGNLPGIDRFTPGVSGIGIYTLLPNKGAIGHQVKIQGYGFSTTPANNSGTFNASTVDA